MRQIESLTILQKKVKLASKGLRTSSDSFSENDSSSSEFNSEASESSESSEFSEPSETASSETTSKTLSNHIANVDVVNPKRIVIKYSSNIEQPKLNQPVAIIVPPESESSNTGRIKNDADTTISEITTANTTDNTEYMTETKSEETEYETEDESEYESEDQSDDLEEDQTNVNDTEESSADSEDDDADMCSRDTHDYVLQNFELLKTIGTGTFGRVCLCLDQKTGKYCAMKIMTMSNIIRLKQVEHVKNEKNILSEVNHPFVVNLIWFTKDETCLYMLFEYVVGGELFTYLRNAGKFNNATANFYTSEIIMALEYLHSLSIVYRDLKPENLLLDRNGHLKITDFGFAKKLNDRTWTLCGTPEYLAPEIIQSKGHNKAVDWWALGILIFEMLCGYPPFYADNPFGIYEKILNGKYEWPRLVDPVAKDLVKKLLVPDRTKRLGNMKNGSDDIRRHRWFKNLDWDDVYNCRITPPIVPKVSSEDDTSNFDDYPEDETVPRSVSEKDFNLFDDF